MIRSAEEAKIMALLEAADIVPDGAEVAEPPKTRIAPRENRLVLGSDIDAYLDAVDQGDSSALSHLVAQVLAFVASEAYGDLVG
jgi:hypothetical protein